MFNKKSMLLSLAACVGFASLATNADACTPNPDRGPIMVSAGADGTPVVEPDTVTACVGETLRWVFRGSTAKEFAVAFRSAEDSPFDWDRQTGATVTGTVKAGAAKDNARTEYPYDVELDGQPMDPRIIIEP